MADRLGTEQKVETESAGPATVAEQSAGSPHRDLRAARSAEPRGGPALLGWVPKLGVWASSFVGAVAALVLALGVVSEIVLPLTFAAVLAVIFKPVVGTLRRRRLKPTLAAGVVVLGLLALMTGVVAATVQGVTQQTDQISASVDAAVDNAVESFGVDQASLEAARAAIEQAAPMISEGLLTHLVSGVDQLIGVASGLMLCALIRHYLFKYGTCMRRSVVALRTPRLRSEIDGSVGPSATADPARLPSWSWWCAPPTWQWRTSWSPR